MDPDDLDLRDIRYFLACLDHGSLTAAARALHVAQPTLSHALHRLERSIGEPILVRRGGLRPTSAGAALAASGRRIVAELQRLAESQGDGDAPASGLVRLASIQSLNLTLLPTALAALARTAPGIAVNVQTVEAGTVADTVRQHRVDLGLVAGPVDLRFAGVEAEHLYDERFVLLLRHDDPLAGHQQIALRQVADRDLVLPPAEGYTGGIIAAAFSQAGLAPRVRLSLASGEALRALVREGLGITILPERYLPPGDPHLLAIPLVRPVLRRRVHLLRAQDLPLSRPAAHVAAGLKPETQ